MMSWSHQQQLSPYGDSAFDETHPTGDYNLSIESRLIKYLRLWRNDCSATVEDGQPVTPALMGVLEWFICDCLQCSRDKDVYGWWSDGVVELQISQSGPESFELLGVTWIDSDGITPFEIEAILDSRDDESLAKCVFRIGCRDTGGRPLLHRPDVRYQQVLDDRPLRNSDWAVALEISPDNES